MRQDRIAAQLFTLRDHIRTEDDIRESLKKVAAIGYRAVQVSGMGPIAEEELVKICDGEGLTICSTHEPGKKIVEETDAVIERLKKLGCGHTAYPSPHVEVKSLADAEDLAGQLDAAGAKFEEAGLILSYHNHAHEFRKFDGRTVLETIYANTDPGHLEAELDLYWVQAGGASPLTWVRKVAGRQTRVHLKDACVPIDEKQLYFCEIGNGNLDWHDIIPELEKGGCEWFIVEQDRCPADPFDSLRQSFEYLSAEHCA